MGLTKAQILQWLSNCAQYFNENKEYLTELDREIGDADHGLNMQRGFAGVMAKLPTVADKDIGSILKTTGMTLLSQVGGASGPLFGTFFIKGAQSVAGKESLSFREVFQMLKDGVDGIVTRGRAEIGDKTMCDVWIPTIASLEIAGCSDTSASLAQALTTAVQRAEECLAGTIPMKAKKGRASYLNERSIGHQDPGATSAVYILRALLDSVEK
ncbi:dihydroxyacetone kinase subunit DhaL [Conservatibacter flavescens]|uniref:Dihydroxyacetone kinase subunit L n=1 Tax=Conservatibacter flavescens TaxID=28161 RepID=A0A2M8S2S6_9PAST|nr:dihydroxyacetone kinase subunit DhaL [Conservatibacter flavescens]PJG85442.1 dihydroxyacetone kinase subunit L [Conservatibacter flavescens]